MQTGVGMKDSELPRDSEKQGYKLLLDSLRDQLLKRREIEETPPPPPSVEIDVAAATVRLPEGKKYFRIGEVAELIGVEAYVLRYWENEFGSIRPKKSRSGQRIYERKDVQLLGLVHHLLHVEKFSLQGAKQKLIELRKASKTPPPPAPKAMDPKLLKSLATDLRQLIHLIKES